MARYPGHAEERSIDHCRSSAIDQLLCLVHRFFLINAFSILQAMRAEYISLFWSLRLIGIFNVFFFAFIGGLEMEKFRPIKADIALAIDTAVGGEGRSPEMLDVEIIQHFLRKITMAFPLSAEDSHIAVVEFAASARVRLPLSEGTDRRALDAVYDDFSDWYDEEGIDRHGAVNYQAMLQRVNDEVFDVAAGDRLDVPNLLIVLTMFPSFEDEGAANWRNRSRIAAKAMNNFSDPHGVVVTTSYSSSRGMHVPKFTVTRGVGTFDPDAWYYQDFNDVLHYAVVHLRHAVRSRWVDAFYSEEQLRITRAFDYATCRIDPTLAFKVPDASDLKSFLADIVLSIELDRLPAHQDTLRTVLLNISRHLPLSPDSIRVSAVEFDKEATFRILACGQPGDTGFCSNQTALFKALIENWAPQSSPRFRSLVQDSRSERIPVSGGVASPNLVNLEALRSSVMKAINHSGRIPQIFIPIVVFPQKFTSSLAVWYSDFLKSNSPNAKAAADALIITSGNTNFGLTYTVAISPLIPAGRVEMETPTLGIARGRLFGFILNVTKAAVQRCSQCYYDDSGRCVIDVRMKRRNVSGIEFVDGQFCKNRTGLSQCASEQVCIQECERRPWSEWDICWPMSLYSLLIGRGVQTQRRIWIDSNDIDFTLYRYCPVEKRECEETIISTSLIMLSFTVALFWGYS